MIEMVLLEETKETPNKVRWDAYIEGTRFSLYIPKWRVPEPWPRLIYVTVNPYVQKQVPRVSPALACQAPESCKQSIVTHVKKLENKTQTIKYQPEGDPSDWEIGQPYIPDPLTFGEAERLTITVEWAQSR